MITQEIKNRKKTFRAFVSKGMHTIPLMNEFEEYEETQMVKKYDRLIFSNRIRSYYGTYRIILERAQDVDLSSHDVVGEITMTQFVDEEIGKLKSYITSQLANMDADSTSKECKLPAYFAFKAQDSSMRRGYGSYYCGGYYHRGREYGECNYYYVTGIELV